MIQEKTGDMQPNGKVLGYNGRGPGFHPQIEKIMKWPMSMIIFNKWYKTSQWEVHINSNIIF